MKEKRSCKRKDTKPDCESSIGQHFLDDDQSAMITSLHNDQTILDNDQTMITSGFQSSSQHAALSTLIS